jgi:tetratricopeptide (TPR) repeat protein
VAAAILVVPINQAHSQLAAPWVGNALSGAACPDGGQGYGPFDYTLRSQYKSNLELVESAHFTPQVENLISGNTSSDPTGDIAYTLRAWPNHHRALNSMIRLRLRNKSNSATKAGIPAECYLQRAINFSPKDGITYMLFGIYLAQMKKPQEALDAYEQAERLAPDNVQIKYNMGLVLVDLGRYDDAKVYAVEVYSRKFPLPGLMRKLKDKGYWEDDAL